MQSFRLTQILEDLWDYPNRRLWFQWIIVFGVLLLTATVSSRASTALFTRIIILVAGAAGLLILLRWQTLGLLGALLGAFFIPYAGPGGLNVAVIAAAGLSALWIVEMVVRQRSVNFIDRRTTIPILVFIVSALLSFVIGQLPWYPLARHAPMTAQVGGLMIFLLSALIFLTVANTIRDLRWLQAVTWLFVGIGALYILTRMVPFAGREIGRYFQYGATAGSLFWVWLLVIPFSQALLNKHLSKYWRAALFLLVGGTLYVAMIQASSWKSGYLPPLAGMATIVALLLRRKVFWFIPVGLLLAWYLGAEALASDQYSYITRMDAWRIVLQLSAVNPIFGIGFSNYYWYTPLFPILGWHVSFNSHSQYVDIFSQTGLFGLVIFFWIFWEIFRLGWNFRDRAPEGFARAYVYGALGGLVGTLVAGGLVDWILPFVYNIGMTGFRSSMLSWIFLGGLVAVRYIVDPQFNSKTDSTAIGRKK